MSYYNRNYRNRNYRKYRPYYRNRRYKKYWYKNNYKKNVRNTVVNMSEKKTHDVPDTQSISTIPYITDITAVAAGSGSTNRIGNRISIQSIMLRFGLTSADTSNFFRIVLFQWCPSSDTAPTWEDLFEYGNGAVGLTSTEFFSPYRIGRTQSFKIISDKFVTLDVDDLVKTHYVLQKKGYKKTISFQNSANEGNNHIFLLVVSDSSAVTHPTIEGYSRIRFTDM